MRDTMETFVISLSGSRTRRRYISKQMQEQDAHWRFFNAISGREGLGFFDGLDENSYFAATGRIATDGEIGCFASHAFLWRHCSETRKPIVILEDDALLDAEFSRSLCAVSKRIDRLGFVRLQDDGGRQIRQKVLVDVAAPYEFFRYEKYPYGAMAYAISPAVADSFYRQSRLVTEPVDSFIKRFWHHGQPLHGISSPTVTAGPLCFDSTICGRSRSQLHFADRRIRLARKTSDFIQRALFNRRPTY